MTGTVGTGNHELYYPYGLSLDSNSNVLYIADYGNHRIMKYFANSSNGTLVADGNGAGYGITQLHHPMRVHFDASSNSLFIANYIAHNIVCWVLGTNSWTLIAGSATGTHGSTSMLLYAPTDVAVDSMGNVYVSDKNNQRVQFFLSGQLNGTTIAGTTSLPGSTANLLYGPESVVVDAQFNLYVSDMYNSRIQRFVHY